MGVYGGGGWLNTLQIMGHLLAAWHMTGNDDFYRAYDWLITEHRYDIVATFGENVKTVTLRSIQNHSDHELAFLAYHTLLRYEPNPERRDLWLQGMLEVYEWEIKERNPMWAAIVASAVRDEHHLEDAIRSLQEIPLDVREWPYDHSHRKDYVKDSALDRFGDEQLTEVPPYDEIRTVWWNGNLYEMVKNGDGTEEQGPMFWLLPYWQLRHLGVITN